MRVMNVLHVASSGWALIRVVFLVLGLGYSGTVMSCSFSSWSIIIKWWKSLSLSLSPSFIGFRKLYRETDCFALFPILSCIFLFHLHILEWIPRFTSISSFYLDCGRLASYALFAPSWFWCIAFGGLWSNIRQLGYIWMAFTALSDALFDFHSWNALHAEDFILDVVAILEGIGDSLIIIF